MLPVPACLGLCVSLAAPFHPVGIAQPDEVSRSGRVLHGLLASVSQPSLSSRSLCPSWVSLVSACCAGACLHLATFYKAHQI